MRQSVTNIAQQDETPNPTQHAFDRMQEPALRIWTLIASQARRIKPAAVVISFFFAVAFTLAMKGDAKSQGLATTMLPVEEPVETVNVEQVEPVKEYKVGMELERMEPLPPQKIDTETLWLARGIYSETKQPQEQELVAWTIRNRVETGYRDNDSYQEAVLDPYQFSAFIEGTRTREHYANLSADSQQPGFQTAIAIAKQVKEAPDSLKPFPETTRHFYSEQSMVGGRTPAWAVGKAPVTPERPIQVDDKRFRFYKDIS
jgi:hypothetical protein